MTIQTQQITAKVAELPTRAAERATPSEPRRTGAAAPPSEVAKDVARKRAQAAEDAAVQDVATPEFPLQELSIRRDSEIDRFVVQVRDVHTGEVVRQIPSEEWVRMLKRLQGAKGMFVDRKG